MVRASYDIGAERGDRIYYAHLNAPLPLEPGDRVEPGQRVGAVGHTAGEQEGSLGDFPTHLHLGWYEGSSPFGEENRAQAESGAMNPYPLLQRIDSSGGRGQAHVR